MKKKSIMNLSCVAIAVGLIVGCGSESSDVQGKSLNVESELSNLTGTFATGQGQEGVIFVRGSEGNEVVGISNRDGTFSVDVSTLTKPYKIKAESINKDTVFYSYTNSTTHTNVNQITTSILKEVTKQDDLSYLFENTELLSEEALQEATEAIKDDLLVQIYSSGLDADEISIFKDKFYANKLGYDALLEKFNDDGTLKVETALTIEESRDIQRILSKFYAKESDGKFVLDTSSLNKDVFNNFYAKIVERAYDYGHLEVIRLETNQIKYAVKDSAKNFVANAIIGEIKQIAIEMFGSVVGLSEADKEFITELSNVAFKNNFYDAFGVMYRGVKGEDTSVIADPLLEALHNSTLGDPVLAAEKLNDFFGIHGTMSRVICKIPVLNTDREENCRYLESVASSEDVENSEDNSIEYEIDFNDYTSVDVTSSPTGFQVTNIYPAAGEEATEAEMNGQYIYIEFNQDLYQSEFSDIAEITSAKMRVLNVTNDESIICDELKLFEPNVIMCTFNQGQIKYNSKYAFSVSAKNSERTESLSIFSTFTTPAYLVEDIEINEDSGKYENELEVLISIPEGYEVFYTLNNKDVSKDNATQYTEGSYIPIDRTSVLRVVAYENDKQVSPVIRKIYNIVPVGEEVLDEPPVEDTVPDEPINDIDLSALTIEECEAKTLNTTFETNNWTTSLSQWNQVIIACLPILTGVTEDDGTTTEEDDIVAEEENTTETSAVFDNENGLVWQDTPDTTTQMSWDDAYAMCEDLNQASFNNIADWRLPTQEESESLFRKFTDLANYEKSFYWADRTPTKNYGFGYRYDWGTNSVNYSGEGYARCVSGKLM